METGGVFLKEPDSVKESSQLGVDYDAIDEEERLRLTDTKLVANLKQTRDWNRKSTYYTFMNFDPDAKTESRRMV